MTPQQQVFNNQLVNDPNFKDVSEEVHALRKGQQEIKESLIEEKEKQESFEQYVKAEFQNGAEKFKKLESEIETMKADFKDGINSVIKAIKDKENEAILTELRGLKKEKEKREDEANALKKNIISGIVIAIGGSLVAYIFWKLGLTPPSK